MREGVLNEPKQSTAGKGDLTRIAENMRESGEVLVGALSVATNGLNEFLS